MSTVRLITVVCDADPWCDEEWDDSVTSNVTEARRKAAEDGWLYRGRKDYCPIHALAIIEENPFA